ncbi:MAG: sigma-54-dependent Fis family transcriptional regulator [Myxococcales bacterium]|nr:sigma-54-dependent Fis family transcriptional regulator [Myxococcales bacterium]
MPPELQGDARAASLPRILLADDEPQFLRMLRRMLQGEPMEVHEARDAPGLLLKLDARPSVLLLDLRLDGTPGEELIAQVRERSPDTQIIVMTGHASVDSVVACMRAGAVDYLEKPLLDRHRLLQTLQRALEHRALRLRNRELEGELDLRSALDGIVAQSRAMRGVTKLVLDLRENESTVLIEGESGTGKELIARALHDSSRRRNGPFVPVDCGALPEGIIEAELFGYERGAFTGATRSALGLFRSAAGGTLFLDEVGELPLLMQSKLLRAIQAREVRPLGAGIPEATDVRLVAATNRNLAEEVQTGRFRRDLYYRLRVVAIEIPALRERPEDVAVLASHFLERYARGTRIKGLEPEALEALLAHPWEGNVRELENTIEAAVALARRPKLGVRDLRLAGPRPSSLPEFGTAAGNVSGAPIQLSLRAYERACIETALVHCSRDVCRTAKLLGIGRSTLYRKCKELEIA